MNPNQIKQLEKLQKIFNTESVLTPEDIAQVVDGIAKVLKSYRDETRTTNSETKEVVSSFIDNVSEEVDRLRDLVKNSSQTSKYETTDAISSLQRSIKSLIQQIEVDTLSELELIRKEIPEKETPDSILLKLSSSKKKLPLSMVEGSESLLNKSQFETAIIEIGGKLTVLEKRNSKGYGELGGGSEGTGSLFLTRLRDVDITGLTKNADGKYNLGSGGGGGGGQASLQFKDEGTNLGAIGTVDTINFTGTGVTASRASNTITVDVTGGSGGTTNAYAEVPTGTVNSANVTFTLANTPGDTDGVIVLLNGVTQYNGVDYTVSGTTITFTTAPVTGSTIFAYYNVLTSGGGGGTVGPGTINQIAYFDTTTSIASLATATYPALTELSYVKGVTSGIQTQLNGKQGTITLTTTGTSGASTLVGNTLNIPQYSGGGGAGMAIGGSITSATAGSVLFAGAAGVLQQDNASLFFDDTNNRLGIGTATPMAKLQVYQSVAADDTAYFSANGANTMTMVSAGATVTSTTGGWQGTIANLTSGTLVVDNYAGDSDLIVDLGANYVITQTEVYWDPYSTATYKIYTSPDNVTYTLVGGDAQPLGFTGYVTTSVSGSLARYVKWVFKKSNGYTAYLRQLRVYTGNISNSTVLISKNGLIGVNNMYPTKDLDVRGGINADKYYQNGVLGSLSQWKVTGSDIYYKAGFVGVGTGVPFDTLTVGDYLGMNSLISQRGRIYSNGGSYGLDIVAEYSSGNIAFTLGSTRVMTIESYNVGIGIDVPTSKLHVVGSSTSVVTAVIQGAASRTVPVLKLQNSASASLGTVGGTIFNSFTDVSTTNTNGTEDDLYTYTTVANTLAIDGDSMFQKEHVQFVSSATAARRLKKYFAGTLIFDSGMVTLTLGGEFVIETTIIRESATVVRVSVNVVTTSASSVPYATYTRITGLTLTGTNILKTTGIASGTGAASGDIVERLSKVKLEPAAA